MSQITIRALNPATWEPLHGNGQACFISDAAAVAQIIAQRLKLYQGEWWEDLSDGLPLFQSILGAPASSRNLQLIIELISRRITGSAPPFVTGISALDASYQGRRFQFSATVETVFGPVFVTNTPSAAAL